MDCGLRCSGSHRYYKSNQILILFIHFTWKEEVICDIHSTTHTKYSSDILKRKRTFLINSELACAKDYFVVLSCAIDSGSSHWCRISTFNSSNRLSLIFIIFRFFYRIKRIFLPERKLYDGVYFMNILGKFGRYLRGRSDIT